MLLLWYFGRDLELTWGSKRFLRFYVVCGVGAGFIILGWPLLGGGLSVTLGASGAVYGVLTAVSVVTPDKPIAPFIPVKVIWLIPFLFAMLLVSGRISILALGGVLVAAFILRDELRKKFERRRTRSDDNDQPSVH